MKRIAWLVILLPMSLSAFAQTEQVRQLCVYTVNHGVSFYNDIVNRRTQEAGRIREASKQNAPSQAHRLLVDMAWQYAVDYVQKFRRDEFDDIASGEEALRRELRRVCLYGSG